ncbi:hypothetical protein O9X90_19255 [Agrobacterium leguminum]|uniref:hypothetical protein n=1 Tax=Agrobacterium TaxID=357 RepID=UPI0013C4E29F|nr:MULTISPECIES: hypothetical protein [Agrobacterium]MCZ7934462.1 hypothetical protein [Agrobacterium leguminum]WFS67245.1 hypothetical protein CFBP4996_09780 [Agrobacterium leguminum]
MEEIAAAKARQRLLFANIWLAPCFFVPLPLSISAGHNQLARICVLWRTVCDKIVKITGFQRPNATNSPVAEICVFPAAALFNPLLRRQKTLAAASA